MLCDYDLLGSYAGAREVNDPTKLSMFLEMRDACIAASLDFMAFMRGYRAGLFR